jgi:hypothetical protein
MDEELTHFRRKTSPGEVGLGDKGKWNGKKTYIPAHHHPFLL